jgi:glutamate--cysteine ligase
MRIKDEKKYKAIIKASIHQFRKEGFAKASMSKIAKEADVSPGTIYIYFDHKEDLINKLYLLLRKEMSDIVLGDIQLDGCFESAYKKMWLNYYHYCLNHYAAFDYIMQYSHSPYGKSAGSENDSCYFKKIYNLFEHGRSHDYLKNVSDEILFAYTFYPASQLAKRHLCCALKLSKIQVEQACSIAWDAVSQKKGRVACMKLTESLNERLVTMIRRGEKKVKLLGVEYEHFLIDTETLRSYDYFEPGGQLEIAMGLKNMGWHVTYEEDGYIFNLEKNKNSVSFEPGGQFEISLKPCQTLECIDEAYKEVLLDVETLLQPNQALVGLGYHPKTAIDDLSLLPKERYSYMYKYLHEKGPMARNMMKGTAATQVSIDYENEEDFMKKYRVANFLSPFISRVFDASPVFEGKIYPDENLRIKIWEETDRLRSKFPKGALSQPFSYRDYAKYIEESQPIIMIFNGEIQHTKENTLYDLSKLHYLSEEELDHGMSMVFPDVRLKHFLEIRMADALPYPYCLAVPALIKGIFYNQENLDYYYEKSLSFKDEDLDYLCKCMKKNKEFCFKCAHEDIDCSEFVDGMFSKAMDALKDEKTYLELFYNWYKENGTISSYLKNEYNKESFVSFIKGGRHVSLG